MNVLGLGIDIVETGRIDRAIERHGEAFLNRVFCQREIEYCRSMRHSARHFAARFAAKEAVAKAFGTGIGAELGWHDIELRRKASGEPFVELHGAGLALAARIGAGECKVSLSHSDHYAVAQALIIGVS
jgi:holo-[acyl-carrier protein] synthase